MTEQQIVEIWSLFREHCDKKQLTVAAEHFVELLADFGIADNTLKNSLGNCSTLDIAISYYLDLDNQEDEDFY